MTEDELVDFALNRLGTETDAACLQIIKVYVGRYGTRQE